MSAGLAVRSWVRGGGWAMVARYGAGLALALLLLAAVALLRGPAATLDALREATARRDTAEIARRIDAPALRHSLGRLLLQQMGLALPDDAGDNRKLLGQFIISGALVRPLVETLVTPEGLAALLDGQIANRRTQPAAAGPQAVPPVKTSAHWRDASTVDVTVMTQSGDALLVLVLRRDGLQWRLAGVEAAKVTRPG